MNGKTPFEKLNNRILDYSLLKVFGCLCYASTHLKGRHKITERARACAFLGYEAGFKGYKVLDLEYNIVSITRNVIFHENIFSFIDKPVQKCISFFDDTIYHLLMLRS